jgi:hypothetical protein
MTIKENELEDIIMNASPNELAERGLPTFKNKKRQVRMGNYGIADILMWTRTSRPSELELQIIELKAGVININAVDQICRYLNAVMDFNEMKNLPFNQYKGITLKLIGSSVDKNIFEIVKVINMNKMINVVVYTYHLSIDGIKFRYESKDLVSNRRMDLLISQEND